MTPPLLGVYDYHAIEWLYKPIPGANRPEDEVPVLESMLSKRIVDPMYRYSKQQFSGNLDPNAQTEDLGDDQVKATRYAMNNLRYIMENMNEWVKDEDPDFLFRRKMNFSLINIQFYWYWTHVLHNLGGIYQYEKYEGDPFPAYKVVPREKQRESLLFLLETLENTAWLNNPEFEKNIDAINGNAGEYMQFALFPYLMRWVANIGYSEAKGGGESYTQAECIADVFNYLWKDALDGKQVRASALTMQKAFVQLMISQSGVLKNPAARATAFAGDAEDGVSVSEIALLKLHNAALQAGLMPMGCMHADERGLHRHEAVSGGPTAGFEFMPKIGYQTEDISHLYYSWLVETQSVLEKVVKKQKGKSKIEYEYLLLTVKRALTEKK